MSSLHSCRLYSVLLLILLLTVTTTEQHRHPCDPDLQSLISFKTTAGTHSGTLVFSTWVGSDPCSGTWVGVRCVNDRVASIVLDNSSLTGNIDPLLQLSQLQVLSLRWNSLSGILPGISNSTNPSLRFLLLSHNAFSGNLNLSLPSLISLRIDHNAFSGGLDGLILHGLLDLDVSNNLLVGEIPLYLSNFSNMDFGGNLALCGSPLQPCVNTTPLPNSAPQYSVTAGRTVGKIGTVVLVAIAVGDVVMVSIVLTGLVAIYRRYLKKKQPLVKRPSSDDASKPPAEAKKAWIEEKKVEQNGYLSELVCFEGGDELTLDTLLKASAEVLGKSTIGSTYRAVLDDGLMLTVKRLDINQFPFSSGDFERQIHLIGNLRHTNLVSLLAYHSTPSEKLLVYDFIPNGNLRSLLHTHCGRSVNGRGNGLSWRRRKEVLMDVAQGLNCIHTFPSKPALFHGNITPSNILIDGDGNACVSEWGLIQLATSNINRVNPDRKKYLAPEVEEGHGKGSQASDVYSFGMVLMEVVTDKEIDEVEWEEEVMGMVKIGMMCSDERPEQRPRMSQVVRMISEMI